MKSLSKPILIVGIVGLAGLLFFLNQGQESVDATILQKPRFQAASLYDVDYTSQEMKGGASLPSGGVPGGTIEVKGQLALSGMAGKRDYWLRFESMESYRFSIFGQDDATPIEDLIHKSALVSVAPDGRIEDIACEEGAPLAVCRIFRALAEALMIQGAQQDTATRAWTQMEERTQVTGLAEYRLESEADALVLHKRMRTYRNLRASRPQDHRIQGEATWRFTLSTEGSLASLRFEESYRSLERRATEPDTFTQSLEVIRLESSRPKPLTPPRSTVSLIELEAQSVERAKRQALIGQAGGMTMPMLLERLSQVAPGGRFARHSESLWQAVGVLKLYPDEVKGLEEVWLAHGQTLKGKSLLADLLVSAGHRQAQELFLRLLEHEASYGKATDYTVLLQRLSFLEAPTSEVLDYTMTSASQSTGELENASLVTLGSVLRGVEQGGKREQAERLLSQKLEESPSQWAISAIGNAGLDTTLELLEPHLDSTDPRVRRAISGAFRHMDGVAERQDVTDTLLRLSQDPDDAVQVEALKQLAKQSLNQASLGSLVEAINAGAFAGQEGAYLIRIAQALGGERGEALLVAMRNQVWPPEVLRLLMPQ